MKYSKRFLFLTIAIFSTIYSQEMELLDRAIIDKKALAIEQKLKHDRFIMYGLTSLSVAHEVYQWVPLLKDLFLKGHPQLKKQNFHF